MIETLEQLRKSDRIFFECVSGSHAYGLATPESDVDIRGFYVNPLSEYMGMDKPLPQIGDEKHDVTYYSLMRALELLSEANPNMIELLWMPEDCVRIQTGLMDLLIEKRDMFITKMAYNSHVRYAASQIKKAKGQNKKVHNPQPKERPTKEDFCYVIGDFNGRKKRQWVPHEQLYVLDAAESTFPCRPKPIKETDIDLSKHHASSLEHSHNIFRLYYYGDEAKGVFRGDDMLVCESIPIDDEFTKFSCLLIYNQNEYEKAVKEWHSYWDWMKFRNSSRWVDQEKGKLNYDAKNMSHCMRLLMAGESILRHGEPIVRVEGEQLEYLKTIRKGELDYHKLMEDVDERMEVLEELFEKSTLPESVDPDKLDRVYRYLSIQAEKV